MLLKNIMSKLKWGIAGCGKFAEVTFIPALQHLKRSKLISVYSHDINRAKFISSKFAAHNSYDNFSEFLKSDIDVVYISSINSDHYMQVIESARAGKHILCEKPLSVTPQQAEEMVRICEENNVFLSVNYVYRFHPLVIKTKELIDSGRIGKIVNISVNFMVDYAPNDNFRFKKELSGGGPLWDLGSHILDLLRYLGGDISNVIGVKDNIIYKSEVEDYASGIVKFTASGYGNFNVAYNVQKAFNRIDITGYKGAMCLDHIISGKHGVSKLTIDLAGENKIAFKKRANKQLLLLRSFQNSVIHNINPLVTGNDGLQSVILINSLEGQCR